MLSPHCLKLGEEIFFYFPIFGGEGLLGQCSGQRKKTAGESSIYWMEMNGLHAQVELESLPVVGDKRVVGGGQ